MDTTHLSAAQLQKYTYRTSRIVDYNLDDADLETRCPLDNGQNYTATTQPRYPAGQLDLLPLEIVTDILLALDIPSLTAFRLGNRRTMAMVDSLHQYRMILKHCPTVLRAMISIEARSFDLLTLYRTLTTTKCGTCDKFGHYLYLITCKRVCWFCFNRNLAYFPLTASLAARPLGLSKKRLLSHQVPNILTLPGRYTPFGKLSKNRMVLFDRQAVYSLLTSGASSAQAKALDARTRQEDRTTREPRRYMSIISAPYFRCSSSGGRSVDWGLFCAGCSESTEEPVRHFRIKYTEDAIIDHIKRYGPLVDTAIHGRMQHQP